MVEVIVYFVIFVIVGFIGGAFCPSDSVITGYANDPFSSGFIYSYSHSYDFMERLLYIAIPIIVVGILILIAKKWLDW